MTHPFAQLVDLPRVKSLLLAFYEVTGVASALVDVDGHLLLTEDGAVVGAGWKSICLDFHRVHPVTAAACLKSDTELALKACQGQPGMYECLNGLVDLAIPVVIDGEHLVNLFTGQFLFQPPDRERFRRQAAAMGFDEERYLRALEDVPVLSPEFVGKTQHFLEMLASSIADMGLKQKRLAEELVRSQQAEAEAMRAQQAVEEASKARSRFFAAASHDLRQPLQALRLFMDVLSDRLEGTVNQAVVERACQGLASAEGLLSSLFDVARIEAGVAAPAASVVALDQCFALLAKEMAPQAGAKGLRFECRPTDIRVWTDQAMLERILRNLLANALRHTDHGGILLRCRRRPAGIAIDVWDSGHGIGREHLAFIWEEFYQVGNPSRDRAEGLGLGLSIARKLAATLGLDIRVTSKPGRGTLFRVTIPLGAERRA